MTTLLLQWLVTPLFLAFGVLGSRIARRQGGSRITGRHMWALAGYAFLLHGVSRLLQDSMGTWAYLAGAGSRIYDAYLEVLPAANHSRTFAMFAFCGVVAFRASRKEPPAAILPLGDALIVLAGMLTGVLYGLREGRFDPQVHFAAVSITDAAELVLMLSALLVALTRNQMDRLLWLALACYAFSVALNILWTVGLRAFGVAWTPPVLYMHLYRVGLAGALVAAAVRRWRLAERGAYVGGLLAERRTVSTMGD
jgi:hypothetical protein